jgi:hypothetical protein
MIYPKFITDRCKIKTNKHSPHHPRVEEIKPFPKPCEDCGNIVDRVIEMNIVQSPKPYWRVYCKSCRLYKNPVTGKFEISDSRKLNFVFKTENPKIDK